jgi:anti-sigma B factor antagonist
MTDPSDYSPAHFTLTTDGDTAVATFHRVRLTDEDNIEQLGQELFAIVDKLGFRKVILNLVSVQYATSAALGKWITLHRKLSRGGGTLVLCQMQDTLRSVLEASRLLTYFRTSEDMDGARELMRAASNPPLINDAG